MSTYTEIICEIKDSVAHITLNRPEKRNALSCQLINELKRAIAAVEGDASIRVIVLRGAGTDFCAGADLVQLERISQANILENLADAEDFAELLVQIRNLRKPVIAAVQGRAFAGGAGLASCCDLVLATKSAQFSYPEVKIGFVPAMVLALLRRNLGEKRAFEMLTTAKVWSAEEAERIGLVNRIAEDAEFETSIEKLIGELVQVSASAVMLTKSLLYHTDGMNFEQAVRAGATINAIARITPDCQRGIQQFLGRN